MQKSDFIGSKGVNVDHRLVQFWNAHLTSRMHEITSQADAAQSIEDALSEQVSAEDQRKHNVTRTLARAAVHVLKEATGARSFEREIVHLYSQGVDVGDVGASRKTFREWSGVICQYGRDQLKDYVGRAHPMTGAKPTYGIMADKATDFAHEQELMSCMRLNYNGTPNTLMLEIAPLGCGDDSYDPDSEGSGLNLFNMVCEAQETHLGVALFEKTINAEGREVPGDAILVRKGNVWHSEQWRFSAYDGEGCFSGKGPDKSVVARTKAVHGLGDSTHGAVWDGCHILDLSIDDAHDKVPYVKQTIHPLIRDLCGHHNGSPHEKRRFDMLRAEWGVKDVTRGPLFAP